MVQETNLLSPPGVVVAHAPASGGEYLGSPALARLPDGDLVASHDFFGPTCPCRRTDVYGSQDEGRSWSLLAELDGQWWSSLFVHRGALYLFGTTEEYGHTVIRRSTDGGRSWTTPKDLATGLLLREGRYHCAPVPVVEHAGRLWRAMEDAMGPGGWPEHFGSFVMSADADTDLLRADNWTRTNRLAPDALRPLGIRGWLEGNIVITPAGEVVNLLRVDGPSPQENAAYVRISSDGREARFDPERDLLPFPGGAKKFQIRRDPHGDGYWAMANPIIGDAGGIYPSRIRNRLALLHSPDARRWEVRATLLHHPDQACHGFQYPDWIFDGDDLLAAVRTAHDDGLGGAPNQHDSNFLTFHRFAAFRTLRET